MADENKNLVKISDLPLGHRTDLEGSFVPVALPNQQTYKVPLEEFMDPLEIMVAVYGTTSREAVTAALSAGKTIFAARQVSSVTRLAPLTDHATGAYHFVWQNSDGTRELWELTSSGWTEEALDFDAIDCTAIKDNAFNSDADPMHPDNITDIEQLTFLTNVGTDANYTEVTSEKRAYGILIPAPSMQADHNKVPMYKNGDKIEWVSLGSSGTIEHVLNLDDLDAENTTFNVDLTPNRNNAISFIGSSEEIPLIAIEINENQNYNIQIIGACTLSLTGVEWWSDAVTDVTSKAEVSIMNGRAIGVVIDA